LVVNTSASDCLERLGPEMIYYVSRGTLNSTHSLTILYPVRFMLMLCGDSVIWLKDDTWYQCSGCIPVVVAAEHDSDNVFADIMDISFHRRYHQRANIRTVLLSKHHYIINHVTSLMLKHTLY